MSLRRSALVVAAALLLGSGSARADASVGTAPGAARPDCGEQTGDRFPWRPLPPRHPAWRLAHRFLRGLARRDFDALHAIPSGFPFTLRIPRRYEAGRVADWELDAVAFDPVQRGHALRRFLRSFPRSPDGDEDSDLAVLGPGARADFAPLGRGAVRIRVCPDWGRVADGTYDQLELTLRADRDGAWKLFAVEVTWFEQR